jgi:hypothetical protein
MRFRALATLLACLAVLAGAVTVAAAHDGVIGTDRTRAGAPCSACDDCDKTPCPMPMADCIQMHANAGPSLPAAPVELPSSLYIIFHWSPAHSSLSGLSPPPDPFPPRA